MDYASRSENRGSVASFSAEDYSAFLGVEPEDVAAVIDALSDIGWIVDGCIANWRKHQPERERENDHSTERVRAHRERKRSGEAGVSNDGTHGSATEHVETPRNATERQETPRGDKIRKEERRDSTLPPGPEPAREGGGTVLARWGGPVKAIMTDRWPRDAGVAMTGAGLVEQWHADGWDLELDVLPVVRQLCADQPENDPIRTLKFFSRAIARRHAERKAGPEAGSAIGAPVIDGDPRMRQWRVRIGGYRKEIDAGTEPFWVHTWGPKIGEPGCQVPDVVLAEFGIDPRTGARSTPKGGEVMH